MIRVAVIEEHRYSKIELLNLFTGVDGDTVLNELLSTRILQPVKDYFIDDEDHHLINLATRLSSDCKYKFCFVGVLVKSSFAILCYPKYIDTNTNINHLKLVMKVIEKYNASHPQNMSVYSTIDDPTRYDLLSLIIYLLYDYIEHGVYMNTVHSFEINGPGEINWDKTINESFTFISRNKPYYLEIVTKKKSNNEQDIIRRIHLCVITLCSKQLIDSSLDELFDDLLVQDFYEEQLEDIANMDEILYILEKELSVQFNTRKQFLLKTLYTYISKEMHQSQDHELMLFGSNNFNLVWEDVCKQILGDQREVQLKNLPITIDNDDQSLKLKDLIEKPIWELEGNEYKGLGSLIPDVLVISREEEKFIFNIFDAKYYQIRYSNGVITNQPGIGDVTKQYLYQQAYKSIIHDDVEFRNYFLMPSISLESIRLGEVKTLMMLSELELVPIQVISLSAISVYNLYLRNERITLNHNGQSVNLIKQLQ